MVGHTGTNVLFPKYLRCRGMIRFAANLGMLWPGLPLPDRMAAAARAGFGAVEAQFPYDIAPQIVRQLAQQLNLTLLGINSPPGDMARGELGFAALPGQEAAFMESIEKAIEYCELAGFRSIHVMAGNVSTLPRAACRDVFTANLRRAADVAALHNIQLLLEPLNRVDHPGYFYGTVDEGIAALVDIARPNVKLQFDAYHAGVHCRDVIAALRRSWPWVGHIQIAAVPDRGEPDQGEVDMAAVIGAAAELGYSGWISCEYRPRGDTDEGLAWMRREFDFPGRLP
jgi:hydroxypyruvate isomerase